MSKSISVFWWRWLMVANLLLTLFGLALLFLPNLMHAYFYWLIYGSPTPPPDFGPEAQRYIVFFGCVLGGIMVGWAISLFYLTAVPFRRGERWAWSAITLSVVGWFAADSIFSVVSGYPVNVLQNVAFLVLYGVPLLATYRTFHTPLAADGRGSAPAQSLS